MTPVHKTDDVKSAGFSFETLQFFQELLGQVRLPADHEDFDTQAARISMVRRELAEALDAHKRS